MTTQERHVAAGAYALGVMDPADAWHFEAHADGCATCMTQLAEFDGVVSLLASFASSMPPGETWVPDPGSGLLYRVIDEIAVARRRSRRRRMYLVAAAAALALGSTAVTGLDSPGPVRQQTVSAEKQVHALGQKVWHTDPATSVAAMVGTEKKEWGTDIGLELKNVKGPMRCRLVVVGRNGEEETVSTWWVPQSGFGVEGSASEHRFLYAQGGAAMDRTDIERFDVRTLDGRHLVSLHG
ncbi:zf-HC2 domain-containing protein [Streptomyces sp. NPDC004647]|uniref:zf-HC2 domain-containing protein n=1 Tax=Streptomyces sp. NPDC004647 TaxID=3154671 RepID=UPI0033B5E8C2